MTEARILGVHHIALPFPGTEGARDEARRFYGIVLGLKEKQVPPALPETVLWYAAGNQELHLFAEPASGTMKTPTRRHPCFQVDDLQAFRAQVERSGIATIDGAPDIPGRPRFFAMDPFGNAIEFVEIEADH